MAFTKIDPKQYEGRRATGEPSIRFHKSGLITLSKSLAEKLEVSHNSPFIDFFKNEDDNHFYISKSNTEKGCRLRARTPSEQKKKYFNFTFNSIGLVNDIAKCYDMPLGGDKKVSVRMDVDIENCEEHDGMKLYKIY